MRNKILIVMPSRGRPWRLLEAIASAMGNSKGLCDILVCMDNDDPQRMWVQHPRVTCWQGPRQSFIQWVNSGVMAFVNDYDIFAWGADDVRFLTPSWDEVVVSHMGRKDGIIYGPDGIQDEKLPTHPFVGCAYPRALGYFINPAQRHYYADNWFQFLGRGMGTLKYVEDLKVKHDHYCRNNDLVDLTYKEASYLFNADCEAFCKLYDPSKNVNLISEFEPKVRAWMEVQPTPMLRPSS